ncbi:hypothetical protein Psi02_10340 [Planotetraspora silvatica]|uniref:Uncharacterized protein n=1 Tax=Planotetraspora silvatica TaxID=234614 RepID=A0A8J3UU35_9ACTN|nr:hypothetical protein Psi02_10340 [Planotetraspora silvatica]
MERAQHPVAVSHQLTPVRLEVHGSIMVYGSGRSRRGTEGEGYSGAKLREAASAAEAEANAVMIGCGRVPSPASSG